MRLVVSFTIEVFASSDGTQDAIEVACSLLPPGCEDIVIVSEEERDRDAAWMARGD